MGLPLTTLYLRALQSVTFPLKQPGLIDFGTKSGRPSGRSPRSATYRPIRRTLQIALQWRMPELTRKRVNDRPVTWHIHYAGARVGMIMERSGVANTGEPWERHC